MHLPAACDILIHFWRPGCCGGQCHAAGAAAEATPIRDRSQHLYQNILYRIVPRVSVRRLMSRKIRSISSWLARCVAEARQVARRLDGLADATHAPTLHAQ